MSIEKFNLDKYANFPEWYHEILKQAKIVDIRYPVKGMNVWMPYGLKALRLIQRIMIRLLEETGHEEAYFPTMIPESIFSKEKDFLKGFGGETFVVEGTLTKKFGEKLLVRPTSETVMYYMWSLWIKGRKDLPIKMYQVVNVFRYETKMTHPILRVREIMGFIEAHTAHPTMEEAEKQIAEAINIYKKFFDQLLIPYYIVKTPPWDTFAGAEYNYDFIIVMPDGKGLELGSVINLGQKFSKAFDIKFMDSDGRVKYVYQTCYGISERTLGAIIGIHGDKRGLFFPPQIAPIQVVIVPIARKGEEEELGKYISKIEQVLRDKNIRYYTDWDPEHTPGWKYYFWEMKGVPTRIEVGRREVENKTVTIARRDGAPKTTVKLEELVNTLEQLWKEINNYLYQKALEHLRKMTIITDNPSEAYGKKGLIVVPWDGSMECAEELEESTGKQVLGEIIESPIQLPDPKTKKTCQNKTADRYALLGTTY